jgi:phytoene desaturase
MTKISIIGSGFAGLSAAAFLAKKGHTVDVYEKNAAPGGRCSFYKAAGFGFDMGPSWYWMPDVFERFFASFGNKPSDFYDLVQLDPGFRIYFGRQNKMDIPARREPLIALFESIEPGSGAKLIRFLQDAKEKYATGMQKLVYQPADSWSEFMRWDVLRGLAGTSVLRSVRAHVRSYFKNPQLIALMEFPVLFLGAMPKQIPSLYTLMNYAALDLGTWYPMGGMHNIIKGMVAQAEALGVNIHTSSPVEKIIVAGNKATHLLTNGKTIPVDGVISGADYHHTESKLLDAQQANYDEAYWNEKVFAPSCLIFYLGVNKKIAGLIHHNLFFDADLDEHADDIYAQPQWPRNPLFYVCCPSKTDPSVAPVGQENLFVLVPIATRLKDTPTLRNEYYHRIMSRMELLIGEKIADHVVYRRDYCINDFVSDYNAYGGNAYGLANTLRQTAVLKPKMRNAKIHNLFYTGQLTVPGPGIPPALISGEVVSGLMHQHIKSISHETTV